MQHHAQLGDANGAFIDAVFEAGIRQEISSDGFPDKLRIGHIIIEGPDEVVAVSVGVWDRRIAFRSVTFRVAHPVHEVARPLFTEGRRFKQLIDR